MMMKQVSSVIQAHNILYSGSRSERAVVDEQL